MMEYVRKLMELGWEDLPEEVRARAKVCTKDIIATYAGSLRLPVSGRAARMVLAQYGEGEVPLWFRGRGSSRVGAAFYNALSVDSLDCHDGFRPVKGHAGATVVPVALGECAGRRVHGRELLVAVVLGYELACRAGMAVHRMYEPTYHSSGAWAAVGAAAAGARILGVPEGEVDLVLGAAEYYAPISPILRCTAHPSAVKDGAGAGAWAGAMSLSMWEHGLEGLPSLFSSEEAGREVVGSLGEEWLILRQYFKLYPTCRWTHPAVEGVDALRRKYGFTHRDVERIDVETFEEAAGLTKFPPEHSDGAQYCMQWAVAAMLVDGNLGVEQVDPGRLSDPEVIELGRRVRVHVAEDIQERFPEECLARVTVTLRDGRSFSTGTLAARGDYDNPLSDEELEEKFRELVAGSLGEEACEELREVVDTLDVRPAEDLVSALRRLVP